MQNQVTFMRIMRLVEGDPANGEDTKVWDCPPLEGDSFIRSTLHLY